MDVAFLYPIIVSFEWELMDDELYCWFIGFYLELLQIGMASIFMLTWVRK